ncbi:MAG: dTMP kinase [Alphaproteobacteria bacterium]|nr:dTMP kinase [Alphaproteobacteria bacterium]
MARGRFITFEGGEGAGKSTQLRLLTDALAAAGVDVVATREPGGSLGAEKIRKLLVTGEPGRWDAETEALLHFAARRDHLTRTIWPALEHGAWVLCDRFADSTMAYQGYGQGLGRQHVEDLYRLVVGDFVPDLTLVIDVPAEHGLKRADARAGNETRYERMGGAFHARLREAFLDIAKREPQRCVVIDGSGAVDSVAGLIRHAVQEKLGRP